MKHSDKKLTPGDEVSDFLLYTAPGGQVKVEVLLGQETIWLTQPRMAELFGVQRPAITKHLKNIFETGELEEEVVCSIMELTTPHGAIEGKNFYAHVQDKFHFAITGHTAAELIYKNADASRPLMGMHTYKNAPDGRVLKSDATVGKNFLPEEDIKKLERTVTAFFDYIEGIIERRQTFTMEGFAESVNKFLEFNEYRVLEGYGSVTRKAAEEKAAAEYEKFNKLQKLESDFDKSVKALEKEQGKKPQ
jgi:hypothetical protein